MNTMRDADIDAIFASVDDPHDGIVRKRLIATMARLVKEARDERDQVKAALRTFIDLEEPECSFDHHGYCQAHGVAEPPCYVAEARKLLADR